MQRDAALRMPVNLYERYVSEDKIGQNFKYREVEKEDRSSGLDTWFRQGI